MFTTDGIQAIKQPKIRELLDKMIVFPPLQKNKPKRLSFPIEHSSLVGYAVEILLDFHLNQDLDVGETAYKYYRPLENFVVRCERNQSYSCEQLYLYDDRTVFWNASPHAEYGREYAGYVKPVRLSDVKEAYIDALLIIGNSIGFEQRNDDFYNAVMTVAQVFPTLRRRHIGIKNWHSDHTEIVEQLRLIHDRMKVLFPCLHRNVGNQIALKLDFITCRPDFIIDNILLESKCTSEYLTKEHIRQVVFYYLAFRLQGRSCAYKIDTIQIYYGLHGELVSWAVEDLLPKEKVKYWINKLKAEIESTP